MNQPLVNPDLSVFHVVANRSGAFSARFKDKLPKGCQVVDGSFVKRLGLGEELSRRTAIPHKAQQAARIINEALTRRNGSR